MYSEKPLTATITLDPMRNRIRIYKHTLHNMADPAYIQFLINPDDLYLAILGSDKPLSGGTANKIKLPDSHSNPAQSIEFYSTTLLTRLFSVLGDCNYQCIYRLYGEVDAINRVAYFSLKTLQQVQRRRKYESGKN